jgi:hypothetical protein
MLSLPHFIIRVGYDSLVESTESSHFRDWPDPGNTLVPTHSFNRPDCLHQVIGEWWVV